MIGRAGELARVERLLEGPSDGPALLAIEAPPGTGKTAIWRAGVGLAADLGYRVLQATAAEPDAELAFGGLGDLFDAVPGHVIAGLSEPQRRALGAALAVTDPDTAPSDPTALARAALNALRLLGALGPVLVAIDDEQWFDPASARVLAFALNRLRDEPVRSLIARRPHSGGTLWDGLGGAARETLALTPLAAEATSELLAAVIGRRLPNTLVRRIHSVTGGNPLYAISLARALEADGQTDVDAHELVVPRTLDEALSRRLDRLAPAARAPLLVAAMVTPAPIGLIGELVPEFQPPDLDGAEQAEVIEIDARGVRFSHPLLASLHYQRAPRSERQALHRVLAAALDDELERASHLVLGTDGPDDEVARTIERAADSAARRGSPETAGWLLEHAARLTSAGATELRQLRAIAASERHFAAGNPIRARAVLEPVVEEVGPGPIRARALAAFSGGQMADVEAGRALLEEAIENAGDDPRLRARLEAEMSLTLSNLGRADAMLEHAAAAVEHARAAGDPGTVAVTLAAHANASYFCGQSPDLAALRDAIAFEDQSSGTTYYLPTGAYAFILFWSDQLGAAIPALQHAVRTARERGEELDHAALRFALALALLFAGRPREAEAELATATELARGQGDAQLDLWLLAGEAIFAAARGDLAEARSRAEAGFTLALEIGDTLVSGMPAGTLAWLDLWDGDPGAARERLLGLRESLVGAGMGFAGTLMDPLWSCDAEALIALGDPDGAVERAEELLERGRRVGNHNTAAVALRCRGLALAARGETAAALKTMTAALSEHDRRPLPAEIARTLLETGAIQRRLRQKSAAKRSLEQALAVFEPLGASMWTARAKDELSRVGLRRATVSDGLTPAQTRVAELVAAGMSNREIAGTLYMSPRSVEAHLTKVYREYGVRSRAQLVVALGAGRRTP